MTAVGAAAIVTGASDGIGAATATRLAEDYRLVIVNYRNASAAARQVVEQIRASGGDAVAVQADVATDDGVRALFDSLDEAGVPPVGLLVNNAGVTGGFATVDTLDPDQLNEAYRGCLLSTALCTREASRRMEDTGGVIVNVSSTAARTTGAGEWVHYAAIKAAVNTHTRGAALELADRGIRVNAVAPGLVTSPLHARNGDPSRPGRLSATIPLGRAGEPDEVAACLLYTSPSPRD